ncbi:MAG: threonine synthase [Desulfocapsaceae bacterium]|nr:threonine synthase [Desulfocapsaceae bacterium]
MITFNYRCTICSATYDIKPEYTVCPRCSVDQQADQPLHGVLEVELNGTGPEPFITSDLLPVEPEYFPPIPVGNTPLWEPRIIRTQSGFKNLYIKDDGSNPTSSFKDRASYLVSAAARKFNIEDITLASTGNAGSSMAGVGAAAGQRITLFLPKSAPSAKLVQALQYGARVFRVNGNYDKAYDLSLAFSRERGGINRNTAYNPLTIEGKKTVSLELFQQLGRAPDVVFVSVGDGCILAGVYKGFKDLMQLGYIPTVPKIIGVQAQTSSALTRAFQTGIFENLPTSTVADSICVDVPRNGVHALSMLKTFNGQMMTVTDSQILEAQSFLSSTAGLFTEPAGAAAFAGFQKAKVELDPDSRVVVLTTGNGLKDTASAALGIDVPEHFIDTVDEIL